MILSRAKPAIQNEQTDKDKAGSAKKQVPTIEQFLEKRDYTGNDKGVGGLRVMKQVGRKYSFSNNFY